MFFPLDMGNRAPIGVDLENVKYFFESGIPYATLTHGKGNQLCYLSEGTVNTLKGLNPFGENVVAETNRVGIMVDISYVVDSTFSDVLKMRKAPLIASHSSSRLSCQAFSEI
jgi:membrane dipeptidase